MMKDKVALVTGSTSGIGLGIARKLASKGVHVVLNGIGSPEEISNCQKGIVRDFGVEVDFSGADLSKPQEIQDMIAGVHKKFGRLDILVNNAGIQFTAPIESFPPEKWDAILAINLSALFHTIRHAIPLMQKQKFGRIINIASAHGLVASEHKVAYVAAKHGVVGLTKVVALENAQQDITCNAICPGWVLTPLVEKQIDAMAREENLTQEQAKLKLLLEKQPSGRFVNIDDLGDYVIFLCSTAGGSMTGSALSMDGGWTAQ